MSLTKAIAAFNELIAINNDRIKGYLAAASEMETPELRQFFRELSDTSLNCRNELRSEVLRMGGNPEGESQTSGKFFQVWVKINEALSGHDLHTLVKLFHEADNAILDAYKNILIQEVNEIKAAEQELLNRQYALLKEDYEKMKVIRNVLKSEQHSN